MKRLLSLLLAFILALANLNFAYAAEQPALTKEFVKEAELSVTRDDKGEQVILLTNVEEVPTRTRSQEKTYAQTTVAILGENEEETAKIIENIQELQRGSGQFTEDGWFYGSSVYLSSTIYYTTNPSSTGFPVIGLNRVTMQCTTNSGSSVSKMTLTMIQQGYCYPDLQYREQRKDFDAKNARSFSAPSSWYPVDMNSTLTVVGAAIDCTATRPGGGSSTFRLTNNIVG